MIENDAQHIPSVSPPVKPAPTSSHTTRLWPVLLCALAFLLCILATVTPLQRMAGVPFLTSLPTGKLLALWGAWLPADFHWLPNSRDSFTSTNNLEFLALMALAFVVYGLFALLILRLPEDARFVRTQRLIWIVALIAGLILVFTPAMLSHDLFVYADYGRNLIVHHSNLYFVPPIATSNDQITLLDDWRGFTAAYGPLWLYISAVVAIFSGDHPAHYILFFRLLGLAAHLFNAWLVMNIVRQSGRSPRISTLVTLLYVLNPLVLLESCLGGHNDIVMITLILLGILLCMRVEQGNVTPFGNYLLPAIAFTLAALIKFTCLPLLLFYLVLLVRRALYPSSSGTLTHWQHITRYWRSALFKVVLASLVSGCLALVLYAPFWIGHSISSIVQSFTNTPSARNAENSILRAIQGWVHHYGMPPSNTWAYKLLTIFNDHGTWNTINEAVLVCTILIGIIYLWRSPSTQTLVLAALGTLGALLIVTPWFFAWYATWLVALASVALAKPGNRLKYALVAFALAFSVSAFSSYLANGYPLLSNSGLQQCLRTFGIPLFVFVIVLIWSFFTTILSCFYGTLKR